MMREVLLTGRMPPWQADPRFGRLREGRKGEEETLEALDGRVPLSVLEGGPGLVEDLLGRHAGEPGRADARTQGHDEAQEDTDHGTEDSGMLGHPLQIHAPDPPVSTGTLRRHR